MRNFFVILFLFLASNISAQYADIMNCSAKEFVIAMDSCTSKIIVDIRPESFSEKYRIEGAMVATNKAKLIAILDSTDVDSPLFLYCVEGIRSKSASKIAQELGFQYIFNLKKGIINYKRNGYPVVDVINIK